MLSASYRQKIFARIKASRTKEEAQQVALELWHHMNFTQEGFICPGCANCAIAEDVADFPQPPPSPEH